MLVTPLRLNGQIMYLVLSAYACTIFAAVLRMTFVDDRPFLGLNKLTSSTAQEDSDEQMEHGVVPKFC